MGKLCNGDETKPKDKIQDGRHHNNLQLQYNIVS